jgi:hypothetical protein
MNSQVLLENEAYKSVYEDKNTNSTSKQFQYTLLSIYEATFSTKYKRDGNSKNDKIPQGTRIFCKYSYNRCPYIPIRKLIIQN